MNVRRPVTAALVAASSLFALAVPAGAAVPNKPADQTIPCNDGSGKSAQVWYVHHWAVKNPCAQWLNFWWNYDGLSDSKAQVVNVPPGAHFQWHGNLSQANVWLRLSAGEQCGDDSAYTAQPHGKQAQASCAA